jgi:hypothetical protein
MLPRRSRDTPRYFVPLARSKQLPRLGAGSWPDVSQAVDLGMSVLLRDLAGMQRRIDGEVVVPGS